MDSTGNSTKVGLLGELIGSVGASVHLPGADDYVRARNVPGSASQRPAAYVVNCRSVDEVRLTVSAARARHLPLSVRGGGQDWVGQPLRQERLVVDLSTMRRVVIDPVAKVAIVAGGATSTDVIRAAQSHGLVAVTGNFGCVGMAGFTLSGGYGSLTPKFGLALDNLLSADVVLEDGSLVTADSTTNGELFWGLARRRRQLRNRRVDADPPALPGGGAGRHDPVSAARLACDSRELRRLYLRGAR